MDIFDRINAGVYKNALPYARPKEDRAAFDAYQAEVARLNALFMDDLRAHLGMEAGPAFDALFALAWERGHSSGFSEVAIEAGEAADLLKTGAVSERAACAELARATGCICDSMSWAFLRQPGAHHAGCPVTLAERIEARGRG